MRQNNNGRTEVLQDLLVLPSGKWTFRAHLLVMVLSGNILIDSLEVSVGILSLPAISDSFQTPLSTAQWVVTGFALGFASFLLLGTRAVAKYGSKPVYSTFLLIFAVATVVGAAAQTPEVLIATRMLKGACAAFTAPTGMSIIAETFKRKNDRYKATLIYSLVAGCGFTAGLLSIGILGNISWRLAFLVPAPVVVVLLGIGLFVIPSRTSELRPESRLRGIAVTSVIFALGLVLMVLTLVNPVSVGRQSSTLCLVFALTATCILLLIRLSKHARNSSRILGNHQFIWTALCAFTFNGAFLGFLIVLGLYFQSGLGLGLIETALRILPVTAPMVAITLVSNSLQKWLGNIRLIMIGTGLAVAGYLYLLVLGLSDNYWITMFPSFCLIGLGFMCAFAAFHAQAVSTVGASDWATANGLYQTGVQTSATICSAIVVALLHAPVGEMADGIGDQLAWGTGLLGAVAIGILSMGASIAGAVSSQRLMASKI
ncbi:MFS transporter [Glutamicibacter sp. 287]|uniref:MFS transporter n=1 Tax=unclassified Glutamicibacter TaxID=2627139 RepID=UPI000BB6C379|nr:MFS transporter [Glutamicibacter sp. BW80]PCC27373.1 hypothetical protein CIK76_17210 [Glutamicibacter sp. BW80]